MAEIERAAERFVASGADLADISAEAFPLPTLAPLIADMRRDLIHGIGFRVLSSLPIAR